MKQTKIARWPAVSLQAAVAKWQKLRAERNQGANPPYSQTEGYSLPFPFEENMSMAKAMRAMAIRTSGGRLRAAHDGIGDHVQRVDRAASRELVIMNWEPDALGQLY